MKHNFAENLLRRKLDLYFFIPVSGGNPVIVGALSGDGAGHLIPTRVRRERLGKLSKRQLEEEAAKVLDQAERVDCKATSGEHNIPTFNLTM